MIVSVLQTTNLAGRLALEVGALAALSYWGFHLDRSRPARIVAGIGAPLAAAVVWAMFASPNTDIPVTGPVKASIQLLVFAVATGALLRTGRIRLALLFASTAVVNTALMIVWSQ